MKIAKKLGYPVMIKAAAAAAAAGCALRIIAKS